MHGGGPGQACWAAAQGYYRVCGAAVRRSGVEVQGCGCGADLVGEELLLELGAAAEPFWVGELAAERAVLHRADLQSARGVAVTQVDRSLDNIL